MSTIHHRHLGRDSAHRRALLRNLVTSLLSQESITTTWHKAKEAQRMAEKVISWGKKNTNASRRNAQAYLFDQSLMPKLFGPLRERYADRPGGYTRVLRVESKKADQAESAILQLVDGPRDMRFAMTAKALVRMEDEGLGMHEMTALNMRKVTRFRRDGEEALQQEVDRLREEKARMEAEEKKLFEEQGVQWEWVRDPGVQDLRNPGPGKVKKRRVRSVEYGAMPDTNWGRKTS
ncbi:hypothetical protein DV736_g2341, partial [Chaetothyriales sp. CBS 134916]